MYMYMYSSVLTLLFFCCGRCFNFRRHPIGRSWWGEWEGGGEGGRGVGDGVPGGRLRPAGGSCDLQTTRLQHSY